ncbi:MAG: inner membrane CreD family protein, partial [Victivallaceae bacterium]
MNETRMVWMADFREKLRKSITVKLVVIGVILLVLLIPTLMVHELVSSRKDLQAEAEAEVAGKWGMPQTFCGPFL